MVMWITQRSTNVLDPLVLKKRFSINIWDAIRPGATDTTNKAHENNHKNFLIDFKDFHPERDNHFEMITIFLSGDHRILYNPM